MSLFSFRLRHAAFLALVFLVGTDAAFAANGGGGGGGSGTPWTGPLDQLTSLLTGTPTKVISIVAIVVAGIALIFGEDLGAFAKRLLMVVIATAMIVGATSIVGSLGFGFSNGALVP